MLLIFFEAILAHQGKRLSLEVKTIMSLFAVLGPLFSMDWTSSADLVRSIRDWGQIPFRVQKNPLC